MVYGKMKTEAEIEEKLKEAYRRYDGEENWTPDKAYFDAVVGALVWVRGDGDDPFMDYE